MFDLSVIPYIVFAFMVIPPFIFGYFKGWRSGLFTLLLTVVTGGILIGVSVGIYDSVLWQLFKNTFISNHNPGGLDIESLKEISKTSVISIAVGIVLVPSILLMWGIYLIFKKLLNKYMLPSVKKVSNNEVTIQRKNLKLTKVGGVLLNGTAGLIVASAATGAVSTLVVPSKSSNFFYSMTNIFSDGMTFGQSQYNKNYQRMFEFVRDGDQYKGQIQKFTDLFYQSQDSNGAFGVDKNKFGLFIKPTTPEEAKAHEQFIKDTNLMAKDSEEISKALVLMFLNASNVNKDFHLVGFDQNDLSNINKDNRESIKIDDGKVKTSESNIKESIENVMLFAKYNSSSIKWNKEGVQEGLKEFFDSRFVKYEYSPYRFRLNNSNYSLDKARTKLSDMNDRKNSDNDKISQHKEEQKGYVRNIVLNGNNIEREWDKAIQLMESIGMNTNKGSEYPSLVNKPDLSGMPWGGQWVDIAEDGKESKKNYFSFLPSINGAPTLSKGSYANKVEAFERNEKNLQATQTHKDTVEKIQKQVDDANNALKTLNYDLGNLNQKITGEKRLLNEDDAFLSSYNKVHSIAEQKLSNERALNQTLKDNRSAAEKEFNSANTQFHTYSVNKVKADEYLTLATNAYNKAKSKWDELNIKYQQDIKLRDKADQDAKKLKGIYDGVKSSLVINGKQTLSQEEQQKEQEALANYTKSKEKLDKLKQAINDDKEKIADIGIDSLETNMHQKEQDLKQVVEQLKSAENLKEQKSKEFKSLDEEFIASNTKITNYQNDVDKLEAQFKIKTDDKAKMENEIPLTQQEIKAKQVLIDQKNLLITKLTANLNKAKVEFDSFKVISDKSTSELRDKEDIFNTQVNSLKQAGSNISNFISEATTLNANEKQVEGQLRILIKDRNVLTDKTTTKPNPVNSLGSGLKLNWPSHAEDEEHWSILDQQWVVDNWINDSHQYKNMDIEKQALYKSRRNQLINSLTEMLS